MALGQQVCTFEQTFKEKFSPQLLSRECGLSSTGEQTLMETISNLDSLAGDTQHISVHVSDTT
jgi:hypothetical protein